MTFLIAAAVAILAGAPAVAKEAPTPSLAELVAQGMRPKLPMVLNDGLVMTQVKGDGRILLVIVEDRENVAARMSAADAAQQMAEGIATGFCEDKDTASEMLGAGFAIRADLLLVDGSRISSPIVDRCPEN